MIEGETDPVLFELLGVFQEGIGCDRVSDLITFILRENILQYTQRVVIDVGITSITVRFGPKDIKLAEIHIITNRYYCFQLLS